MSDKYAMEIEELSKNYAGFSLKNISLKLKEGMVMGFIGQNGA